MNRNQKREIARKIGRRIRRARAFRGVDLDAVAALSGIAAGRLKGYEAGRGQVTVDELDRLAAALGVPVLQFLGKCVLCGHDLE